LAHGGMEAFLREKLGTAFEAEDDQAVFSILAEAFLDWYDQDPSYIRLLLFSALENHELAELCYQRHFVSFLNMMGGYIQRRIDQGVFRVIDPILAIRCFTGMISDFGMSANVYRHPEPYGRKTIIDTLVSIFLNGIRK